MIDGRIAADSVIKLKAYILLLLFYSQKECKLRSRVILNWIRIMLVYSEKRLCEVLSQAFSETKWVFLLTGTSDRAWKKVVSGIFGISIGGRRTGRVLASAVDRKAGGARCPHVIFFHLASDLRRRRGSSSSDRNVAELNSCKVTVTLPKCRENQVRKELAGRVR